MAPRLLAAVALAAAVAPAAGAARRPLPPEPTGAVLTALPRPPAKLWRVAWMRPLVKPALLEWGAREPGGPAVDAASGAVVVGSRDGMLRAVRADGSLLWEFATGGPFLAAPRVNAGVVYAGSGDGRLYALELGSGRERWRYDAHEEVASAPVLADGVLYFSTMQDTVFALDADSGAWKWHRRRESRRDMTVRGAAAPAVVDGTVYAAWSDGWISALDAKTGAPRWERRVAPPGDFLDLDATPQVAAGRVYVAAWSGAVAALDAASGSTVWETPLPGSARLQLAGDTLVAVTAKSVLGISTADGRPAWSLPLPGVPAGSPVAVRGLAVVPTGKALLWIDVATGRKVRELDPGTGVTASPAAHGHRMYVLSNGGELLALDLR